MSINKCTPGKWDARLKASEIDWCVKSDGWKYIAANIVNGKDAKLIASSKDMYLALQEVVLQLEKFNDAPFVYLKRIASEALPKL